MHCWPQISSLENDLIAVHNFHECEKDFKFSSHEMCAFETKVLEEEVGAISVN